MRSGAIFLVIVLLLFGLGCIGEEAQVGTGETQVTIQPPETTVAPQTTIPPTTLPPTTPPPTTTPTPTTTPPLTTLPPTTQPPTIEEQQPQQREIRFDWTPDPGTRTSDGSVPYIHKLESGEFRLYYCGAGGILSAVSTDGLNFEKESGVRIAPERGMGNSEWIVCDATIIDLPGGEMRMYYKGSNGPGGPGEAVHKVFSAVSSNGLNFQKEGVRIDSEETGDGGWASVPEALRLPDGRIRIYYVFGDFEAKGGTMSAVSQDGLSFQKESGARVERMVDPAVTILPDGRYLLLAVVLPPPPDAPRKSEQPTGIYSFTSDDGLVFEDQQPVLLGEGVYDPSIVRLDDDTYRVFYGKDIGEAGRANIVTKSITGRLR